MNARNAEGGDGDGLLDPEEIEHDTDPVDRDTDDDGYNDAYEVDNAQDGFDPLEHTEVLSRLDYALRFVKGFACGSFCEDDSMAFLGGDLTAGFVLIADVRDFITSSIRGDVIGSDLSLAGLVPWVGDSATFVRKVVQYAGKSPIMARRVLGWALRKQDVPVAVRIDASAPSIAKPTTPSSRTASTTT